MLENEIVLLKDKVNKNDAESVLQGSLVHDSACLPFKCELCDFVSKSKRGLGIHTKAKHKDSFKAPIKCIRQSEGCTNVVELLYSYLWYMYGFLGC